MPIVSTAPRPRRRARASRLNHVRGLVLVVAAVAAALVVAPATAQAAETPAAAPAAARVADVPAAVPATPILPTAVAAASPTNTVWNITTIAPLGVIHIWDHNYGHGHYDVALEKAIDFGGGVIASQNSASLWGTTAGFYIAPGWCAQLWRRDFGTSLAGDWVPQFPDIGSGEHQIGSNTSYQVKEYRLPASGGCR